MISLSLGLRVRPCASRQSDLPYFHHAWGNVLSLMLLIKCAERGTFLGNTRQCQSF